MTSTQSTELCRITVHGPTGRVDLAVPLSVSVGNLLPVLLKRAGGTEDRNALWVLQKLGEAPFDLAGSPETLDWRDGDELYLRPVEDTLPELAFDDVADGVATAVSRHPGRWRPEFNRSLFLGLSIAALVVVARALLIPSVTPVPVVVAAVIALALLIATATAAMRTDDRALILLLGLGGSAFAGLAGALGPEGSAGVLDLASLPVLIGGLALALAAGMVLVVRAAMAAPAIPFVPFGVLVFTGTLAAVAQWLHLDVRWTPAQVAGALSVVLLGVLVFAPRLAIRLARIRGPQLPRTASELQSGVEPLPGKEIAHRVAYADGHLTIAAVGSAAVFTCSFPFLVADGVFGSVVAVLTATAVLLRARAFIGGWQRVSLAVAGSAGLAFTGLAVMSQLTEQARAASFLVLGLAFVLLVISMLRPPDQRMLPIWGHVANGLELVSALAVVPVLLQLFGVYTAVRGLAG
jgi:type VII secretion integral membrane protein EccD